MQDGSYGGDAMSKSYTVYEKATGKIVQTGSTPQMHAMRRGFSDEYGLVESPSDPDRDRVVNGVVVSKPSEELTDLETTQAWNNMRANRNRLLSREIDTLNPIRWESMPENKRQEWRNYRRQLLDLPQNTPDPRSPIWPKKPDE